MDRNFLRRRTPREAPRSTPPAVDCLVPEVCVPFTPPLRAYLLRVIEGVVVDSPLSARHPDAHEWAATCQPDATAPDGWSRTRWWDSPTHRGWLPVDLDHFDVVEFAADVPLRHRWRRTRLRPVRWCGIALEEAPLGLVVYGPYPTLDAAGADADRLRTALSDYVANRNPPRRPQ